MRHLPLLSLKNYLCRLISFCLAFQMIIFLPKAWSTDSLVLAISKPIEAAEKQMISAPSDETDQASEETRPDLKEHQKKKITLEAAINRALEANRGLEDFKDQVEGTRLSLVAAESEFELKIIPAGEASITGNSSEGSGNNFGAGISLQKKIDVGTDIIITPRTQKSGDLYNTGVNTTLIQPLLRGFGREYNLSAVNSAEFGVRSAQRSFYLRQVNTVLLTISAVYDVIRQRELFKLNEESALRFRAHAEAAKAKLKIGLATQIDVYRATIQQKQAEDNLNTAREAYFSALDNLKILLSLPLEEEIVVEAPLDYSLVRLQKEKAIETALQNRVELDQSKDNVREAERISRVAKHNIWPDLDVVFNYSQFGRGDRFGNSTGFDQDSWGIGLVTTTDLARTVERVAYDQSLLNLRSSRRNYSLLRDEVVREVKRDYRNLRGYEKGISIQEEQIQQAKGQLELAQVKFRSGLANNFDLIDAETKLRNVQTNLLSTVLDYIVGINRLRASMGTLLERPKKF